MDYYVEFWKTLSCDSDRQGFVSVWENEWRSIREAFLWWWAIRVLSSKSSAARGTVTGTKQKRLRGFFSNLMMFIDFQFYIQFYHTLLSLTTLTYTHIHIHINTSSSSFLHSKQFFLTHTYSSGTIAHYCTLYLPHFISWANILLLDLAIIVSSW